MFNFDFDFDFSLDELEIDNIGAWPFFVKMLVTIISCGIIYYLCNWIFISSNLESLQSLKAEEQRQRIFFANKQKSLFNISDYKNQIGTIESRLEKLTKKLPAENEVPELLNQISQAGHVSNLEFKEIKILPEKKFKYYVELPIHINIVGDYHKFGEFVSKVSSMPRVITFHDFSIEPVKEIDKKKKNLDGDLEMVVLAKTYRYINSDLADEQTDDKKSDKGK